MQRLISPVLDGHFRKEVTIFEAPSEFDELRTITPEGDYPIEKYPGHILRITFERQPKCGSRTIEVVKADAPGEAPKDAVAAPKSTAPVMPPEILNKFMSMPEARLIEWAAEHGVTIPKDAERRDIAVLCAQKASSKK